MKKSIELKQKMTALQAEIEKLNAAGQVDEATAKLADLKKVGTEYQAAVVMEMAEGASMGGALPLNGMAKQDLAKMHNAAFVKAVMGRQMTDEERSYAMTLRDTIGTPGQAEGTPEKGGYLVPEEQLNKILEWRRTRISLKDDCDVVPVSTATGYVPTAAAETGKLTNFDEISDIATADKDFGRIAWKLSSYGTIVPISNELLADNNVDIVGFIAKRMAFMGVNSENDSIFNVMAATKVTQTGTDYKAILKALNLKLDSAIAQGAKIYTDATGFDYLDEAEDKNGRPLLTPSYADPAAKVFRGHPVVVLPSLLSVGSTEKAITLYVGSLADGVKFFDRAGVSIAMDSSAGFTQNKTLLRAIERFDVQAADAEAIAKVTINLSTT